MDRPYLFIGDLRKLRPSADLVNCGHSKTTVSSKSNAGTAEVSGATNFYRSVELRRASIKPTKL